MNPQVRPHQRGMRHPRFGFEHHVTKDHNPWFFCCFYTMLHDLKAPRAHLALHLTLTLIFRDFGSWSCDITQETTEGQIMMSTIDKIAQILVSCCLACAHGQRAKTYDNV